MRLAVDQPARRQIQKYKAGEHENSPENGVALEEAGNVVRFWNILKVDLTESAVGWMDCGRGLREES